MMRLMMAIMMMFGLGCQKGAAEGGAKAAPSAPAPGSQAKAKPPTLDGLLAEPNVVLLDVRTGGEWSGGHLKGATHLELRDIDRIAEVVPKKDTPIVVYCLSGARAGGATNILRRKGYTRVINGGGLRAIAARSGRPIE